MTNLWRPLTLAAALNLTIGAAMAVAQTVVVTNAPAKENIELVVNATPVASGTTDARGDVRLPVNLQKTLGKAQIDAHIFVDACGGKPHRVIIVEQGGQLPVSDAECERHEVSGLYWIRDVNTIVVDVSGTTPSVLLIKGPYDPRTATVVKAARLAPTGLAVFGGGALVKFADLVDVQCGNVTPCSGKNPRYGFTAGADVWVTRFLAAEAAYIRPSNFNVTGSGDAFRFNSALDVHIFTLAGKVAIPVRIVRIYGIGGANYHRATSTLSETIDDKVITVDGVERTIKGGTQTASLKTQGWGWLAGGGMEVWASESVALYGEADFARVKGSAVKGEVGQFSDRMTTILFGLRVHVGRKR